MAQNDLSDLTLRLLLLSCDVTGSESNHEKKAHMKYGQIAFCCAVLHLRVFFKNWTDMWKSRLCVVCVAPFPATLVLPVEQVVWCCLVMICLSQGYDQEDFQTC